MPNILDQLQEDKLAAEITHVGARLIMNRWRDTALEISRTQYRDIVILHQAYSECSDAELRPDKVISFLDSLYQLMADDDERRKLITTEAIHLRRTDRR